MSLSLVNTDQMLVNADNDPGLVRELVEVFLNTSGLLVDDLCAAWDSRDSTTLARAAHTFKSPLDFLGAEDTRNLAQRIEKTADAGDTEIGPLIDQLLLEIQQIRDELHDAGY